MINAERIILVYAKEHRISTLSDLSAACGLPLRDTHSIVKCLCLEGLLKRDACNKYTRIWITDAGLLALFRSNQPEDDTKRNNESECLDCHSQRDQHHNRAESFKLGASLIGVIGSIASVVSLAWDVISKALFH